MQVRDRKFLKRQKCASAARLTHLEANVLKPERYVPVWARVAEVQMFAQLIDSARLSPFWELSVS